jgi:hypothetical protein
MTRMRINRVQLQSLAQLIRDELDKYDYLTEDAKVNGVNQNYALITIYESLSVYFEPID